MKIVHIIPSLATGGAERLVVNICQGLQKAGHDVKIIIFSNINEFSEDCKELDIIHLPITYSTHLFGRIKCDNVKLLDDVLSNFKPDIIHSHLTAADIISRINPIKSTAYVTHLHGINCIINIGIKNFISKKGFLAFHDHYLINKLFKGTNTKMIAISNATYDAFINNVSKKLKNNISIIYNCIDFEKFKINTDRTLPKKGELIKFINCGRTVELKNQSFLIDVIDDLVKVKGITNIKLEIVGDGPLTETLQNKINLKNLQDHISLIGSVQDVESYYSNSHIYLHSGLDGIFGLSTLEALSSGLPLVGNTGPEDGGKLIKNEINGIVVENNNLNEFTKGIQRYLADSNFYSTVSKNNEKLGFEYSIESYIPKIIKFYENSLN